VNDAALTQRLADVGVDSICSDTPAVVRQALLEIGRLAGVDTTLGRSATENGRPACDVRRPETAAKTPEPGAERPSR